ncbi:MAG TPA: DUF5677 domain-containing protein [Terriglobales bacterium]|nr:DUF5677 domain-containing protein [Terriglobales bacterium]
MKLDNDLSVLTGLAMLMVESRRGEPIPEGESWRNDAQVLANKLIRHVICVKALMSGVSVPIDENECFRFLDHASVKVLSRAALETHLVFCYIFNVPDEELSKFRHMVWKLAGLCDRQRFVASTKEGRDKIFEERPKIEKLVGQISNSDFFFSFSEKQRLQIIKGNWKVDTSWSGIGQQHGFRKEYFDNMYNFLCSYSHSSYLSILQIGEANSLEKQEMLARAAVGFCVVILAKFCHAYMTIFPQSRSVLDLHPDASLTLEAWNLTDEQMGAVF